MWTAVGKKKEKLHLSCGVAKSSSPPAGWKWWITVKLWISWNCEPFWEVRNSFIACLIKKLWLPATLQQPFKPFEHTGEKLKFEVHFRSAATGWFLESTCNSRALHGLLLWLIGVFVLSCHVVMCEFLVGDVGSSGLLSFHTLPRVSTTADDH